MENVSQFPINEENPIKEFFNKPMYEATIGDTLILHAGTVLISIALGISVQGWVNMIKNGRR